MILIFLDTIDGSARLFWKDHQREFPILTRIARDIMSIPATGAGVERLFNSARDICHYRRGSLNPETIRDIMLYMCTTRFDLKEEQRLILQEYLMDHEMAASAEALDIQTHSFDAISDNEEDVEVHHDIPPLSAVAAGKRPAVSFGDEEDSDADEFADIDKDRVSPSPDLPDTQYRVSGRMRKKSRLLDGYIT
jgi:hAT family dimerisation domain.